ncbi:MAG: preprotein translocase subunit SecG [Nitrosomonas sp. PRO4]|nr:preprotein translocase subunit SecG [Nitrosomonas sp. PRO4]
MEIIVWTIHIVLAVILIVLVLLQHGKGADMGAAFGSGSAGSLFGASGSANFLSRTTSFVAAMFFITSMGLTYYSANQPKDSSVMGSIMDQIDETEKAAEKDSESNAVKQVDVEPSETQSNSRAGQIPE